MGLRRLCKSADSVGEGDCPAMYVDDDDASMMVSQCHALDARATTELCNLASNEVAGAIPAETVLRATGLYLAERGFPSVLAEVERYLASVGR